MASATPYAVADSIVYVTDEGGTMQFDLDSAIRKVPDFPKPGILFYDITSILTNPGAFRHCVDSMVEEYRDGGFAGVAAIEARGFVFAAPFAYRMGIPLILVRKRGKLPGLTAAKEFELEYGEDVVEIHVEDVPAGGRILLVDDLIATGGTICAAADLLKEQGAIVQDIFAVVGLPFLNYRSVLGSFDVKTLIEYHGE
jgi:adenine phosphoribosyltransferase